MPNLKAIVFLIVALASGCGVPVFPGTEVHAIVPAGSALCDEKAQKPFVASSNDTQGRPKVHRVVEPSKLKLVIAQTLVGPCVSAIENHLGGQVILTSGLTYYVRADGSIRQDDELRKPYRRGIASVNIKRVAGYDIMMADRLQERDTQAGKWAAFVGLLKGEDGYVIARFDTLGDEPSKELNILVRSTTPISAINYLPAPDWPAGQIGFVQPADRGKAWIFMYDWDHGRLQPLKF